MTDYEIEMELEAALEALPKENPPVNLSDWNSGSDYKEKLASVVKLGKKSDLFDYQYFFLPFTSAASGQGTLSYALFSDY